jgi:hypothetical protein
MYVQYRRSCRPETSVAYRGIDHTTCMLQTADSFVPPPVPRPSLPRPRDGDDDIAVDCPALERGRYAFRPSMLAHCWAAAAAPLTERTWSCSLLDLYYTQPPTLTLLLGDREIVEQQRRVGGAAPARSRFCFCPAVRVRWSIRGLAGEEGQAERGKKSRRARSPGQRRASICGERWQIPGAGR